MREPWRRLGEHWEEAAGALLLAAMAVLAFVNVLTRYFIQYSLAFTEELEVGALVWLTMLGAAAGFQRGAHLSVTFFVGRLAPPLRRVARALALLLGLALFLALVGFALWQIRDERLLGITSEALGIPQWWYTAGLVVGGFAVLVRLVQAAGRLLAGEDAGWM